MYSLMGRLQFGAVLCLSIVIFSVPIHSQKQQREPLTADQQDKIAEAGVDPDARIALYTKFANEHARIIEGLGKRTEKGRGKRLDGELQDFTAIVDELASNLDEYGERKADLRKSLKGLNESIADWQRIVKGLPKDPVVEIAMQDATEALGDLAEDAKKLAADQDKYFTEHKDAKGQEREEPQ